MNMRATDNKKKDKELNNFVKFWIASPGSGGVWRDSSTADIDIESEMNPFHKIWWNEDILDRLRSPIKKKEGYLIIMKS